jgi:acyl carrier protein
VPQAFRRIDALPLTPNGKVDEAALRASGVAPSADLVDTTPPDGALEERIAAIWRDVLKRRYVGIHASFFELGGTSLAAMEVALRICREFEVDLPLQAVFTHSTVARLAARVEELIVEEVAAVTDEEAARLVERAEARHD